MYSAQMWAVRIHTLTHLSAVCCPRHHRCPILVRIHAPVLITRLSDGPAQHAIVLSSDGFLYMVDGLSGCADTLDIGEDSYR